MRELTDDLPRTEAENRSLWIAQRDPEMEAAMKRFSLHLLFRRRKGDGDDYDRAEDERLKAEVLGSWGRTRDGSGLGAMTGHSFDKPGRH